MDKVWDDLAHSIAELDEARAQSTVERILSGTFHEEQFLLACQRGMEEVGCRFEAGDYFLADLMFAAEILSSVSGALRALHPPRTDAQPRGVMVLGTVRGDIHDIGKNIYKSSMEAAGFTVHDLGVDIPPQDFVAAVTRYGANLVGLSGVLSLSIESMRAVVEALSQAGLRQRVRITLGGAAVTSATAQMIGADFSTNSAVEGVRRCHAWAEDCA